MSNYHIIRKLKFLMLSVINNEFRSSDQRLIIEAVFNHNLRKLANKFCLFVRIQLEATFEKSF